MLTALAVLGMLAQPSFGDEPTDVPAFFTEKISDTQVKVYAKDIVNIGKVQFLLATGKLPG